jgi:hypothetical protein
MGFASYKEDIVDRFNEHVVNPAEELLTNPAIRRHKHLVTELESLVEWSKKTICEVKSLLELATDPDVDLARDNRELRENAAFQEYKDGLLESERNRYEAKLEYQQRSFDDKLDAEIKRNQIEVSSLKRRFAKATDSFNRRIEKLESQLEGEEARRANRAEQERKKIEKRKKDEILRQELEEFPNATDEDIRRICDLPPLDQTE